MHSAPWLGQKPKDVADGKDGKDGKDKAKLKRAQTAGDLSRDKSRLAGNRFDIWELCTFGQRLEMKWLVFFSHFLVHPCP